MRTISLYTVNQIKHLQSKIQECLDKKELEAIKDYEKQIERYLKDDNLTYEDYVKELYNYIDWKNNNCEKTLREHGWIVLRRR